jgi:transcriptional regulator GlxA family with amidase domain
MDAFAAAVVRGGNGDSFPGYELVTVGLRAQAMSAECGLLFQSQFTLRTAPTFDTLVIPGGAGIRDPKISGVIGGWIGGLRRRPRRVAAVCTGVFGLAASGLLKGRRVTTHWRYAKDLASRYPALQVDEEALFLKDGPFYSSAGITAGIDLSLALIEEDYGPRVALAVARELVVFLKRAGGQRQYSEPLQYQVRSADRFADLVGWIVTNLGGDLSVTAMAARVRLCPRHFARRFKIAIGSSPAEFVERIRLEESKRRLSADHRSIRDVAASVGFQSDDVFRRAFERRFGITPTVFRARFVSRAF